LLRLGATGLSDSRPADSEKSHFRRRVLAAFWAILLRSPGVSDSLERPFRALVCLAMESQGVALG
jgi:hypothetical protein